MLEMNEKSLLNVYQSIRKKCRNRKYTADTNIFVHIYECAKNVMIIIYLRDLLSQYTLFRSIMVMMNYKIVRIKKEMNVSELINFMLKGNRLMSLDS